MHVLIICACILSLAPHRAAVEASIEIVARADRADLARATPCAGWTLADLLAHMTAQHHGFAAAARGRGADPDVWRSDRQAAAIAADPAGTYAAAARDVLAAFAVDGVERASFALPDFGPDVTVPGETAMGFHFVDYVAHGWDVAARSGPRSRCRTTSSRPSSRWCSPYPTESSAARPAPRSLGR